MIKITDNAPEDSVTASPTTSHLPSSGRETILRKIDWRLLPIMFITYNFNFIDKSILSSAAVFGLENDTHLVGQQYSWVSSIFYFGYLGWTYPTTIFIQKLPVGRYVSINTIIWGIIVACTALCTNFGSLLTVRFLLGVAEATITPSFVYITSMWYTREEIPFRTGTWFAGNSFGGFTASLLAYVIGRIESSISLWRWLFIIPNSGTQNFANLVLQGLGFTSLQTTLVGIPSSFIAFFTILITGWLAGKYHEISCYLIALVVVAPVAGSALIYSTKASNGVKLFAYYLLATGPGALPLAMSLMTNNYKGVTKKMTVTAILFLAYCTGNIAGPQTFKTSEAPIYPTAFRAIMICYTLVVVEALGLRIYLSWMNKKLRMRLADSGPPVPVMNTDGMNEGYDRLAEL